VHAISYPSLEDAVKQTPDLSVLTERMDAFPSFANQVMATGFVGTLFAPMDSVSVLKLKSFDIRQQHDAPSAMPWVSSRAAVVQAEQLFNHTRQHTSACVAMAISQQLPPHASSKKSRFAYSSIAP
jgi:hypothetical protein